MNRQLDLEVLIKRVHFEMAYICFRLWWFSFYTFKQMPELGLVVEWRTSC
jgi:hypothetical protein